MNWMLVIIISLYPLSGREQSSQQIGPYASHGDCEKAAVFAHQNTKVMSHFCVPKPRTNATIDYPYEFPPEFD